MKTDRGIVSLSGCSYAAAKDGGAMGRGGLSSSVLQYSIAIFISLSTYPEIVWEVCS